MQKQITLTAVNPNGADPQQLGFDIKKFTNSSIKTVTAVLSRVKEGHLDMVEVEYTDCDPNDPTINPMIIGYINRQDSAKNPTKDFQIRILWEDRLWRVADHFQSEFLEVIGGVDPHAIADFANKLADWQAKLNTQGDALTRADLTGTGWHKFVK